MLMTARLRVEAFCVPLSAGSVAPPTSSVGAVLAPAAVWTMDTVVADAMPVSSARSSAGSGLAEGSNVARPGVWLGVAVTLGVGVAVGASGRGV